MATTELYHFYYPLWPKSKLLFRYGAFLLLECYSEWGYWDVLIHVMQYCHVISCQECKFAIVGDIIFWELLVSSVC